MMTLYEYLLEKYGKLKPKTYKIMAVQRILKLAEKYPQIKHLPDWGLYQLSWGEPQDLGLPDDFPIKPRMRSYVCENLTKEYRRYKGKDSKPYYLWALLQDPDAAETPLFFEDPF